MLADVDEIIALTAGARYLRRRQAGPVSIADVVAEVTGDADHPVQSLLAAIESDLAEAEADPTINMHVVLNLTIEEFESRLAQLREEGTFR